MAEPEKPEEKLQLRWIQRHAKGIPISNAKNLCKRVCKIVVESFVL